MGTPSTLRCARWMDGWTDRLIMLRSMHYFGVFNVGWVAGDAVERVRSTGHVVKAFDRLTWIFSFIVYSSTLQSTREGPKVT